MRAYNKFKYLLPIVGAFFVLATYTCFAQPKQFSNQQLDSMQQKLANAPNDTNRAILLYNLAKGFTLIDIGKSLSYSVEGARLSKKLAFPVGELKCLESASFVYILTGAWEKGIQTIYDCLELAKKHSPQDGILIKSFMSLLYQNLGDDVLSLEWCKNAYYDSNFSSAETQHKWAALSMISQQYTRLNQLDSALDYAHKTLSFSKSFHLEGLGHVYLILGRIASKQNKWQDALIYINKSMEEHKRNNWDYANYEATDELANLYSVQNQLDSVKKYGLIALAGAQKMKNYIVIRNSSKLLAGVYKKEDPINAYQMLSLSSEANDTIISLNKIKQVNLLELKEKQRLESLYLAKKENQNKLRLNSILFALISISIIAYILFRNDRRKHKINRKLNNVISELESTQSQLIESEKNAATLRVKHTISHDLHDEVGSTLTSIQLLSKAPPHQSADNIDNTVLNKINEQTILIQSRIRDIVWVNQAEQFDMHTLHSKLKEVAIQLLEPAEIEIRMEGLPESSNKMSFPSLHCKNILMIFREALNNILKHAQAQKVTIFWEEFENSIVLHIQDNGNGNVDAKTQGSGLRIMQSRAEEIGARLEFKPNEKGCHLILSLFQSDLLTL